MSSASDARVPVRLTQAQRKLAAELLPMLADRLALDSRYQRTLFFSVAEASQLKDQAAAARPDADNGARRNSLWHIAQAAENGLERFQVNEAVAVRQGLVYSFKITLLNIKPPIWRRIEVPDGTLDDLHEHIQAAIGWTNSHLHHFVIRNRRYGDPKLLNDDWGDNDFIDSTQVDLGYLLEKVRKPFRFAYEYDFGDGWEHEILYEGVQPAVAGERYPRCMEGARACPPEDVGGSWGYDDFIEAMKDPKHERHEELREWFGGRFDPEKFVAAATTKEMRRGVPDWR